jgi:transposase InsO family protein
VEKESGKQVKSLKSDNGGEYISNEFKYFFCREGIRRELIAPHNPQQNGVAERNVRKTGPWSNKIKQMQKQNIEDTQYKRDTYLRGSPSVGYVHQRNC